MATANSLWFGGTAEREVGLVPSDGIMRVQHSKSELLLASASLVLDEKTDVMALAAWLQFFVQEWGMT